MEPIHGKDCLLSINIDGVFYPVLCAVDMTLGIEREIIDATTAVTGSWRVNRQRGLKQWNVSLTGLTKINNTDGQISWFFLMENGDGTVEIQIIYEDAGANAYIFTGQAVIPSQSLNANVSAFASGSIEFLGSGSFVISDLILPPVEPICEVQPTINRTLVVDTTSVTATSLTAAGAEVLWVTRAGIGLTETMGVAGDGQFHVDYATGVVSFWSGNPGNGETILIGWQLTA